MVSNAFFYIQEYRGRGHTDTEVSDHVVHKPHALKRHAVTCTKAKLARILYDIFLDVSLDHS